MVSPQITNLIIILVVMQGSKKIDFTDPNVLNGVRAMYLISNLLIFSFYMFIRKKINDKKDRTTLKYVEPAPMGTQDDPKLVTTTIQNYDMGALNQAIKAQGMGVLMMAVMHLYFRYTNPLVIQSIIPLKGALESNLAAVHVFGKAAAGDLKRPWKAGGGGLMGALTGGQGGEIKTDKASIEAAEKAGRGGAKEE